jgi:hypothetical protein
MPDKKTEKRKASQTIPDALRKEIARPGVAKSARRADLKLHSKRIHVVSPSPDWFRTMAQFARFAHLARQLEAFNFAS